MTNDAAALILQDLMLGKDVSDANKRNAIARALLWYRAFGGIKHALLFGGDPDGQLYCMP